MPTYSWPLAGPTPPTPPTPASSEAYARQLKSLLPRGAAWVAEVGSWMWKVLLAISDELSRVDGRSVDLVNEADPRTAVETLSDWERAWGLPDAQVTEIPATTAGRQVAITQKVVRTGGQTPAYFIGVALACGYSVTVTEWTDYPVCRSGVARSGDRCWGVAGAFTWTMHVSPPAGTALTHAQLEAVIRKAAPAQTTVVFVYL